MKFLRTTLHTIPFLGLALSVLLSAGWAQKPQPDSVTIKSASSRDQKLSALPDTEVLKKRNPLKDSTDKSAAAPSDSAKKEKKSEGITDTVYYGTDGGYIDYAIENKSLRLIHNAMVKYQNLTLYADTIVYRIDDAVFEASGKPQLIEGGDTTIGETMIYNIKTRRGRVRYASSHMNDAYFNGKQIIKSPKNELYVSLGDYTTCDYPDTPHYFFYGKNIKLIPDDKIICRPVVLSVGGAPVGMLPFIWFPIQKNRKSGFLTPIFGGHPESGGYLDNLGYYWAFNDYIDLLLSARVQDFQEFVLNGASSYAKKYELSGNISGHYTYNGDFKQRDQQWSLNYSHNQTLVPDGSMTLAGTGNLVSNQSFYRNFSERDSDIINQSIKANLSLAKRFESINASANLTVDRSQNLRTNDITDNLPSLSFSLPTRSLIPTASSASNGTGNDKNDEPAWYNKITYSYNGQAQQQRVQKNTGDTTSREITHAVDLNAPLTAFKWFTINPYFSTKAYTYDKFFDTATTDSTITNDTTFDTLKQKPSDTTTITQVMGVFDRNTGDTVYTYKQVKSVQTRKIPFYKTNRRWTSDYGWNTGVSLSTTLYGVYPIPLFNFVGIRHILRPSIDYRYTPKHTLDKRYAAILGGEGSHEKSQAINISLSNEFQGKTFSPPKTAGEKPQENKFQILSGSISTGYDFEAKQKKWKDLSVNASTGYSVFRLSYNSTFWMYNQNNQLSSPLLQQYKIDVSPNAISARGTIWEGDKIVQNGLYPKDDPLYHGAGPQQWQFSLGPTYSFSQSRTSPSDPFVTSKNYSLNASASFNFSRKWNVSWSSYYNFITNQMVGNNLHFHCDLECWDMVFDWQPSGSYNAGYYFKVNIKKIPEIFWEKRD